MTGGCRPSLALQGRPCPWDMALGCNWDITWSGGGVLGAGSTFFIARTHAHSPLTSAFEGNITLIPTSTPWNWDGRGRIVSGKLSQVFWVFVCDLNT